MTTPPTITTVPTVPTRKASGTRNMTDVLRRFLGAKGPSTADDVADYEAGVQLRVSCLLKDSRAPHKPGHLYVVRDQPLIWRSVRRNRENTLNRPVALRKADDQNVWPMGNFLLADLTVRLPLADIEFLEYALRAGSGAV
jgi:hypothetical protein